MAFWTARRWALSILRDRARGANAHRIAIVLTGGEGEVIAGDGPSSRTGLAGNETRTARGHPAVRVRAPRRTFPVPAPTGSARIASGDPGEPVIADGNVVGAVGLAESPLECVLPESTRGRPNRAASVANHWPAVEQILGDLFRHWDAVPRQTMTSFGSLQPASLRAPTSAWRPSDRSRRGRPAGRGRPTAAHPSAGRPLDE